MKKIIRLTESDLTRIVKRVIEEGESPYVVKLIAIIKGPKEYLPPKGKLIEEFIITQEDIDDFIDEDDGTEEEAIEYYTEEYESEWAQRFCDVTFLTPEEFSDLSDYKPSHSFRRRL